ncbi:MAG TPA: DUF115 domain-containing protein, partial [Candidatus Ozemobacteraceae bacterium]|nr:DUF115 domain-containing protein [Candidatus Ozemobacteraceae bacterium]
MNPILAENLRLISRHPRLVKTLEEFRSRPDAAEYLLEDARNGQKCLQVREKGKAITYHSRYDPLQEARKQITGLRDDVSHVLVLGLGLGYQLEAILESLPSGSQKPTILVVEPDPKVMLLALGCRSLARILADERIQWCVAQTPDDIGDHWSTYLDWASLEHLCIIEHPPSLMRFHGYFERLKEKLRYLSNRSKGNLVTLMNAGFEFHTNNFVNCAVSASLPGVRRLFGRFAGLPAVVVAAGPSLEKNVALLAEIKDRFLIIAVDTAFRQLTVRGLKPD